MLVHVYDTHHVHFVARATNLFNDLDINDRKILFRDKFIQWCLELCPFLSDSEPGKLFDHCPGLKIEMNPETLFEEPTISLGQAHEIAKNNEFFRKNLCGLTTPFSNTVPIGRPSEGGAPAYTAIPAKSPSTSMRG